MNPQASLSVAPQPSSAPQGTAAAANAAAASFAALTESLDYLDAASIEQVRQAYRFADQAHLGQLRNSGEPYITHPIAVAALCASWKLDAQALMAALLHDAMEDCGITKADLIERTGGNCVFDDIELFELKFFALLAEELRPLASQGRLAELPELNGVVDLLDPEGNRLPHFFVYDAYSEELTTLRKQIKARKQAGADESQVQELYFRSVEIEDCIRERLSVELRKYHKALQQALDLMGWLDVVIAKAMQARDWGLTRPAITQDTASFRGLFNPELRISLEAAGKRFQPVNIRLTTGPTVITGANMSGKTVLLHSVELAQYMLQFGFYIAAERAEMALVDEVHCSIGDGQDQLSGLSSFAAEMMRMDELAKSVRAGRRVLALIDEPARTTNPVEGRAIVNGVLEFLADYEVPSLVTTHYNGIAAPCRKLKVKGFSETNAEEKITLKNINDFIDYSLEEVTTDEVPHEAIRIARILGIDPEILRRIERNEELKNNQ